MKREMMDRERRQGRDRGGNVAEENEGEIEQKDKERQKSRKNNLSGVCHDPKLFSGIYQSPLFSSPLLSSK